MNKGKLTPLSITDESAGVTTTDDGGTAPAKRTRKPAAKKAAAKKVAAKKAPAKKVAAKKVAAKKVAADDDTRLIKADLTHYVSHETKTPAGRKHIDIADQTADKLREMTLSAIYKYASDVCDVPQKELHEKYDHLNPGMQRMNLGNRIRAVMKLGDKIQSGFKKDRKASARASA